MYCPICGAETTPGLNYCKRCGTGLTAPALPVEQKASFGKMMGMLLPVALVSLAGFIALFSTVYNLGERQYFDTRALIAIMAFGGATVIGVVGLFVWLLLKLTGSPQPPVQLPIRTERQAIRDYSASQLPAAPGSMSSVTENTTRNFDPVYREKGVRE